MTGKRPQNVSELSNFLPLGRKIFNHEFFKEKRSFSKFEAWVDLLQMARYEVTPGKTLIQGKLLMWERSEIPASIRFLEARWKWGKGKISRFLDYLRNEEMIETREANGQTIIKILNYDLFNKRDTHRDSKRDTSNPIGQSVSEDWRDSQCLENGTEAGQRRDKTVRKYNKEEEINNCAFEDFWKLYPNKVGKKDCKKIFSKLTAEQIEKIMEHLPQYIPSVTLYFNPKNYLNGEHWNDEIRKSTPVIAKNSFIGKQINTQTDYKNQKL